MGIEIAVIYAFLLANPVLIELLVYAAAILIIVSIELGLPQAIAKGIYYGLKAIVNAAIWTVALPFRAVHALFNALFGKKVAVPAGFEYAEQPNDYPQVPPQYAQENFDVENPPVPVYEQDLDIELPPGAAPRAGEEPAELLPPEAYTLPPEEDGADLPPYTEEYENNALPPAYELPAYEDEAPDYEEAAQEQRQRVVFAQ